MRIEFDEHLPVPPEVVFDYFRSPADWPRLYGAFGEVRDLGHGWIAVPLAGDYPDLEARLTSLELDRHAAWDLRGTFAGRGRVDLTPDGEGTRVTGFEEVDVAGLDDPETDDRIRTGFAAIWQSGWDRLRGTATSES